MKSEDRIFSLEELCTLLDMNRRTIRFYIQKGLVDKPEGTGKGAYYTHRHLEQLLALRKWKQAGVSLERIKELMDEDRSLDPDRPIPPPRPHRTGSIEVWSHLCLDDGLELHIEPQRSGLTPEQVRALCRTILDKYKTIKES